MNKKIYEIGSLNQQEINYANIFRTKLNIAERQVELKTPKDLHSETVLYQDHDLVLKASYDSSNIYHLLNEPECISILLRSDTNTNGCTQWFNFRIKSSGLKVFRILNNRRSNSLAVTNNIFTSTGKCFDLFYYKTNIHHPFYKSPDKDIAAYQQKVSFYTLEFKFDFAASEDFVEFAFAEPYPVKRLLKLLQFNHRVIAHTFLMLPLLEIELGKGTKVVIVLARQHPSEVAGSFVCEELLQIINSIKYKYLVYPMVNPDGVFMGNSRCNFFGQDLNRRWVEPSEQSEPEIYHIKKSIEAHKQNIEFFIDLHGHSQKLNYFVYSCVRNHDYQFVRSFLHNLQDHKLFSLKDCSYKMKQNTARSTLFCEFQLKLSLTLEVSLYGASDHRFKSADYKEIAERLYNAIENYDEQNQKLTPFQPSQEEGDSDSQADEDIIHTLLSPQSPSRKRVLTLPKGQLKQVSLPKVTLKKTDNRKRSCQEVESRKPQIQFNFVRQGLSLDDAVSPIKAFPQRTNAPKRMGQMKPKCSPFFPCPPEYYYLMKSIGMNNQLF